MMASALARDYEVPKKSTFHLDGRDIVQSTEASAFVSNSVTDSVMYSTNGDLGLRHLSEGETVGFNTEVLLNGVYHEEHLDHSNFRGISDTYEVGASVCTVDMDFLLDGESGTLSAIPHRRVSLDDAAYRSECIDVMSSDGGLIFDSSYIRTLGCSDLGMWGAEVCYSNFRLGCSSPVSIGVDSSGNNNNSGSAGGIGGGGPGNSGSMGLMGSYAAHNRSADDMSESGGIGMPQHLLCSSPKELNYRLELVVLMAIDQEVWDVSHVQMDQINQCSLSSGKEVTTFTDVACVVSYGQNYRILQAEVECTPYCRETDGDNSSPYTRDRYSSSGIGRDGGSSYGNADNKDQGSPSNFLGSNQWNFSAFHNGNRVQKRYVIKKRFMMPLTFETLPDSIVVTFRGCHHRGSGILPPQTFLTIDEMVAEQRAALEPFWRTHDCDLTLQDEVILNRSKLPLIYNAFRMFNISHGLEGGLSRSGLSAAGDGLRFDLSDYIFYGIYYIITQPEACLRLLRSVYKMLPLSRKYARTLAMDRGAVFPLHTISGVHFTHVANINNARFHVNAEIGYLIALYNDAAAAISTEDRLMLLELMIESARIWPQCGEWKEAHTVFRLDSLAGTDEYNSNAAGNFYIHISAQQHLNKALAFLERQRAYLPAEQLGSVFAMLGMTQAELTEMAAVAAGIVLPQRHERLGVLLVHDNFDNLTEWVGDRPLHPLHINYHATHIFRRKLINVPEVLLGMLLYPEEFDQHDFEANFNYYYPLCTFDSPVSLFIMMHALCRARMNFAQPLPLLRALANIDLDNIVYSAESGLHFCAIAATLQGVIFGCGGVRYSVKGLEVNPILPAGMECYHFTVKWRGATLRVAVDREQITYELIHGTSLRFVQGPRGERMHLHTGFGKTPPSTCRSIRRTSSSQVAGFDGVVVLADSLFDNLLEYSYRSWYKILETLFDNYRVLHNRRIPSLNPEEFIEKAVYQREEDGIAFSGIHQILQSRGIYLDLGTPEDAEIVETRYGLANAKVAEMAEMVIKSPPPVNHKLFTLLKNFVANGVSLAIVSYSRSLKQLLMSSSALAALFVATIDGEEAHDRRIKGQPHLDLYVRAAEKIHVVPNRCIVVSHHLDRCYGAEELSHFRMFLDVEDPFVSSRFPVTPYPTLSEAQVARLMRENPVVQRVELAHMPSSVDEVEDLVEGRQAP